MLASQTLSAKLSSSLSHLKSAENPAMTELEHLLKLIYKVENLSCNRDYE